MNPYVPAQTVDLGYKTLEVAFTWRHLSALQAEFGATEYAEVLGKATSQRDLQMMAQLLSTLTGEPLEDILDKAAPPEGYIGVAKALEDAWLASVVGPEQAKDAQGKVIARLTSLLQGLKWPFRRASATETGSA